MTGAEPLEWLADPRLIRVSALRTLASVLNRAAAERPDWIVIVRTQASSGAVYHYAWRAHELVDRAATVADRTQSLERALNLRETGASTLSRGRRLQSAARVGAEGAVSRRVVDFDAAGRIVAIAEPASACAAPPAEGLPAARPPADAPPEDPRALALPPLRAGATRPVARSRSIESSPEAPSAPGLEAAPAPVPAPAPGPAPDSNRDSGTGTEPDSITPIATTLSAQGPAEVQVGQLQVLEFRIEFSAEATPLAHRIDTRTSAVRPLVVLLSIENPGLGLVGAPEQTVAPPLPGQPRAGFFQVKGESPGLVRAALSFRQGGSELGRIVLAVDVVDAQASPALQAAHGQISTPDPRDDELLELLIEQRLVDGAPRYEYRLNNEALGFNYLTLQSKPLLDRGGGSAKTLLDYVERIYERTTQELKGVDDLSALQREMRAVGVSLSTELFDPDVARTLWPLRARIGQVRITSWEPYIPWELLRMRDPASRDVDERFLAEYGLVRTLSGEAPPRTLALVDWSWLAAEFPLGTHADAGAMSWFTDELPRLHGVQPRQIAARTDALLDALGSGEFDVLHLACHAESAQGRIDRATLIIGDCNEAGSSAPVLIQVDTASVDAEARLRRRRPLVFLNACESGRLAPNLTAWGGWPEVFLRAGAGAFVGTSWAVRDKPATAFARAFYGALLGGKLLHQAATEARASARTMGDASWLAFKVYGHPRAMRG